MRRQRRGKKRRKRPRRSPRQSTRSRILTPLGNKVVLLLRQKSTSPTALCFSSRCDKKFNGSIPSLADNPILNGLNFYVYYVLLFYVLFIIYSDKKIKTNILLWYSILNPHTNSDSPSIRSNGVRFNSINIFVNIVKYNGYNKSTNLILLW